MERQWTLGLPPSQWTLHAGSRCGEPRAAWQFADREAAVRWLRQFTTDPLTVAVLRSIAAAHSMGNLPPAPTGDDVWVKRLSTLLRSGALHVHRVVSPGTLGRAAASTATSAATQAPSSPAPARPSSGARQTAAGSSRTTVAAEEAPTFSSQTDPIATAATLRSAAASGVPFCEECAKAAAASRAAA